MLKLTCPVPIPRLMKAIAESWELLYATAPPVNGHSVRLDASVVLMPAPVNVSWKEVLEGWNFTYMGRSIAMLGHGMSFHEARERGV